ncbi:interleukin-23 receptor [Embiotoca jacksoni]|uniref:interleukin-23 receptor n=1 Tax=Embiotoca jacksoni TaxID=100190 RepID=UPI0037044B1E
MNLSSTFWRCIIILLTFSTNRCPLLHAGCRHFKPLGYLTVEPAPLFRMGSNLTVYCHLTKCQQRFKLTLVLNDETVYPWKTENCTAVFNLTSVQVPLSKVHCNLASAQPPRIVNGLDLHAGLPPDIPGNVFCETTRTSDLINCSWKRGQETHFLTSYNISVRRENGTEIHFNQIQDAGKISIPRAMLDVNTKYLLNITAYNHLGLSQSDPFILSVKDIVIPEAPYIMHIEFDSKSIVAMVQWKTAESSEHLSSCIRLRSDTVSWEVREGTEISEGLIRVDNLKPLTDYEFQMRTCNSTSGLTHTNTTSKSLLCSKWSLSVRKTSPGKGPSQQLHVWRMIGNPGTDGLRTVMVFWKPPPPEDYSSKLLQYKILLSNDQKQEVTCAAALSQCSVQVPSDIQTLSVTAVTSYGTSPPADVTLRQSGDLGPALGEFVPAANSSAVLVSWSWPGNKHLSTVEGKLLFCVIEWASVPAAGLQWQKLSKDLKQTSITGLTAGVRHNVSLYAVTTRGVSVPSSSLIYSREQRPVSGPNMSVLVHEAKRILIQWDELPVDQQRGFITEYTIYFRMLNSSSTELSVTVPGSGPRQIWLDCPGGALALQLTASTSAGEGPRGRRISSQPAAPEFGLVIVIVFIITVFIVIIANLMCWSCVRKRIKQKCVTWGPAWLVDDLPKPGHSNAIRLLGDDRSEPLFSSTDSDPPLSPIIIISQEQRDDVYPTVHIEAPHTGLGQPIAETTFLTSDAGTNFVNSQLEHVSYKPHVAPLSPQEKEAEDAEEKQMDGPARAEEHLSSEFQKFVGGLLPSVKVDYSDSSWGLTLESVRALPWPKTSETSVVNRSFLQERRGPEEGEEADSPSPDFQQDDIMTPDPTDTCLYECTGETTLNGGYFPQVAAVSHPTP